MRILSPVAARIAEKPASMVVIRVGSFSRVSRETEEDSPDWILAYPRNVKIVKKAPTGKRGCLRARRPPCLFFLFTGSNVPAAENVRRPLDDEERTLRAAVTN